MEESKQDSVRIEAHSQQTSQEDSEQLPEVDESQWDFIDKELAEIKQEAKEDRDHAAKERAKIRGRLESFISEVEQLKKEVHYGKEERKSVVLKHLVNEGIQSQGWKTSISADEASELIGSSPRTTRRYFPEMADEYDSISHKRADPNDASLPKRLCMDVEAFLEESDYELQ